ncbi:MAG: carboxypeptidase regulatory-like domain-containing protein [Acidobacteria bacterium]|nr:carboxypeptidase regulatory-like domain-containing protein [Acidobacteriota bacterium]
MLKGFNRVVRQIGTVLGKMPVALNLRTATSRFLVMATTILSLGVAPSLARPVGSLRFAIGDEPTEAEVEASRAENRDRNLPQRIPRRREEKAGALQGLVADPSTMPVPSVTIGLKSLMDGKVYLTITNGEGIFRIRDLPPGDYEIRTEKEGFESLVVHNLSIATGETLSLCFQFGCEKTRVSRRHRLLRRSEMIKPEETVSPAQEEEAITKRHLLRRSPPEMVPEAATLPLKVLNAPAPKDPPIGFTGAGSRPSDGKSGDDFIPIRDRWRLGFPEWDRQTGYEAPYRRGRAYDPYNQNILKGDYPIIGNNIFASLTGSSETLVDFRRVYTPSNVSSADPLSERFFGRGEQFFLRQNIELTFDLFRGSTAFKPQDWVFRITPVFNISYLNTRENGVVDMDVRRGTNRLDGHVGLQEFFGEVKIADSPPGFIGFFHGLFGRDKSPYYDFTSVRIGIQKFNSDFRGFVFREQNLGYRLFGNNSHEFHISCALIDSE